MKRAFLLPLMALALIANTDPALESEHIVKPGETLGGVAQRAQVPRILIAEANGLKEPYVLRAGQKLMIPRTRHHTVAKGDTGFTIAYIYAVPWAEIAVANGLEAGAALKLGQKLLIPTVIEAPAPVTAGTPAAAPTSAAISFAWPIAGKVRRGFAARGTPDYHDGIDIKAPEGAAVRAAAQGRVIYAGNEPRQYGNLVVVDHGGGWHSAYAFLSRLTVKEGDEVSANERVGLVGHTGLAKGSELHFELRRDNAPVNPNGQLPTR